MGSAYAVCKIRYCRRQQYGRLLCDLCGFSAFVSGVEDFLRYRLSGGAVHRVSAERPLVFLLEPKICVSCGS